MPNKPNVVLRGGLGDGQISYFPALGDPMPSFNGPAYGTTGATVAEWLP
jgi:hypothetical protein